MYGMMRLKDAFHPYLMEKDITVGTGGFGGSKIIRFGRCKYASSIHNNYRK